MKKLSFSRFVMATLIPILTHINIAQGNQNCDQLRNESADTLIAQGIITPVDLYDDPTVQDTRRFWLYDPSPEETKPLVIVLHGFTFNYKNAINSKEFTEGGIVIKSRNII